MSVRGLAAALAPWRWRAKVVEALLALGLLVWAALECLGPLGSHGIAMSTYDRMQQWRLWASPPDPRIVIVDIDERSLADMSAAFGRWPWPRDTLATLLEHAEAEGAAAFVFDILFSDPDRLHPGGDAALAAAVRAGRIGLFPAARLPAALDPASALSADRLPGLVLAPGAAATAGPGVPAAPTLALILPFMDAMIASRRLGTHTAERDGDGKIRRFAFAETLAGGWTVRSMPSAVAALLGVPEDRSGVARPIVWRAQVDAYPRVPFSVAWACAEGRRRDGCPTFDGRIVVLGATASSLHDVHASPLSNRHAAVDILATLVDNALHQRAYAELPAWGRFALAALALLAAWRMVRRGGAGATKQALVRLPLLLLAIGFASLHTEAYYLDLMLPAALTLSYLSAVAAFDALRRRRLGLRSGQPAGPRAVACGTDQETAERLERAVFDLAGRERLRVGGSVAACGDSGRCHSVWVLWSVPDDAGAARVRQALAAAVPGAWHVAFEVGADPQGDLARALARDLPPPARPGPAGALVQRAPLHGVHGR
jgi:hypothetical protein